jgi:hypothetical protein
MSDLPENQARGMRIIAPLFDQGKPSMLILLSFITPGGSACTQGFSKTH